MTPNEVPIACSLSASELKARLAEMSALGSDALVGTTRDPATLILRFRGGADVRDRVRNVAAAETECCGFLGIAVDERGDEAVLRIHAPAGAEAVLDDLQEAFSPSAGVA
jgi:hypothetical protein